MKRYYFDYAATTPVDPQVEKAMRPFWSDTFGNPGSLHYFGQKASAAVFLSRKKIADILGCSYEEIIFTGSATEANNLVLRGVVRAFYQRITNQERISEFVNSESIRYSLIKPKIIVSAIEHESILATARDLELSGEVELVVLPVNRGGIVDLERLKKELDERTILVSIMYANNEMGVIQPISEIAKIIKNFRNRLGIMNNESRIMERGKSIIHNSSFIIPLLHVDASQTFNYLPCNVDELGIDPHTKRELVPGAQKKDDSRYGVGVDLMTLSSQKIYGPKGIGALYVRDHQRITNQKRINEFVNSKSIRYSLIEPMVTGGGQESGLRSGTENVPAIVGFAKAVEIADKLRLKENKRLKELRDYFLKQLKKLSIKTEVNGQMENRLPNNLNIYFPDKKAEDLLIKLDLAGFAVSAGSACSARVNQPSYVIKALGYSEERALNSLRITFGRQTNKKDIDKLLNAFVIINNKK